MFQQLVLKEKKTSASVLGNLKGLLTIGMSGWAERMLRSSADDLDQRALFITLEVEEDTQTDLRIRFKHPDVEWVKCIQILVDFSSVQVVRSIKGKILGQSLLTKCEVAAKDAFPGPAPAPLCVSIVETNE